MREVVLQEVPLLAEVALLEEVAHLIKAAGKFAYKIAVFAEAIVQYIDNLMYLDLWCGRNSIKIRGKYLGKLT